MIAAYPWMKRITWWPQLFLGLTFDLGALIGWAATGNALSAAAFTLYAAAICWTLGYDTIYAVQDMKDDKKMRIKSSARAIGPHLKPFIIGCYGAMILLLGVTGYLLAAGPFYYIGLTFALLHAAGQINLLPCPPTAAGTIFRSNQWLGLLILLGILADRLTVF
jgi:4-hydroxybenzoate polyprenyltransferase